MEQTYRLAQGPPAWSWERYEKWLLDTWPELLAREGREEAAMQRFLEMHPCLLPGGEGGGGSIGGHHGAFPSGVITQPPLRGFKSRTPDFLWLTRHSEAFKPVFIEIESAAKPWFTPKTRRLSSKLAEAMQQVAEWREWFAEDGNRLNFIAEYADQRTQQLRLAFEPVWCLIYGQRDEPGLEGASRLRRELRPHWLVWMTPQRLTPQAGARNAVTLRKEGDGFRVVHVPPTFQLGPRVIEQLEPAAGLEDAIIANELLDDERKTFLLERLPYWRRWLEQGTQGFVTVGDRE